MRQRFKALDALEDLAMSSRLAPLGYVGLYALSGGTGTDLCRQLGNEPGEQLAKAVLRV